jgi:large subunit ribosomal protein L25
MKSVPLKAFARSQAGRGEVKKLRTAGRVPAVIYGRQTKPENLEVVARELGDLIQHSLSENILVDLAVDSKKRLALVQEVQHHPLSGKVLHVDFHEVAEDEMVTVMVPVETTGEAAGVKTGGGVLEHVLFKLKVRSLPKNLPEQILIDVTALEVGKTIHIGEIKVPEGVEIIGNKSAPVVSVAMPKTEVEAAPAEGAAASADVEMIKEKKEDGADKAAPAKDAKAAPAKDAKAAPAKDAKAAPAAKK